MYYRILLKLKDNPLVYNSLLTMSVVIHSLYIIDKKVYDLKDWIPIHPGGS